MKTTMARKSLLWFMLLLMMASSSNSSYVTHAYNGKLPLRTISGATHHHEAMLQLNAFKVSFTKHDSIASPPSSFSPSPSPSPMPSQDLKKPHEYLVTSYGADPTGNSDSTEALLATIAAAAKGPSKGFLMNDIIDLGGAQINLEGGNYLISKPLQFPVAGVGNLMIHGGSIRASNTFPPNKNLIDLSNYGSTSHSYNYEYITLKDLFLDSNFKGGGISITNSLRINIDNCYITHFTTNGILVQSGHETYIRNSFIGQHITAGGDKNERKFSGIGINLQGNDNAITDVVIFSAAIGIMITGQANTISGVHCYNKASGFGGTGIYLKLPGLTQTRIVNSYMDYTNIVAEDPVQLHISSSFFLGDAKIVLKSIKGVVNGLNIVDNMFSGSNHGVEIVKLDTSITPFNKIEQVFVARNVVNGMNLKATSAIISMHGNGTSWIADFNKILIFPNLIRNVQYSLSASGNTFPNHALRNVSHNIVVIETNEVVIANIYVKVDQGITS
ncbi:polygalacturonase QRT3 [Trifolium repens]|nr:polygalacturonase QRT3 [Trifolium repens]